MKYLRVAMLGLSKETAPGEVKYDVRIERQTRKISHLLRTSITDRESKGHHLFDDCETC